MTAVIGILNKEGAAIASDSAVTMTRGVRQKISNSADKMIRLTDVEPVSVMIYSDACLMSIPWDLIVRWYRYQHGRQELSTLQDYVDDFLCFLETNGFFCTKEQNKKYLSMLFDGFFGDINGPVPFLQWEDEHPSNLDIVIEAYKTVIQQKKEEYKKRGLCPRFEDYSLESFSEYVVDIVDSYLDDALYDDVHKAIREDVLDCFYFFLTHCNEDDYSGLVFTGYGKDDQFPSLVCVRVILGFDGHLAYYIRPEDNVRISDELPYAVLPFAQTDVIQTLLYGLDPKLGYSLCKTAETILDSMKSEVDFQMMINDAEEEEREVLGRIEICDLVADFRTSVQRITYGSRKTEMLNVLEDMPVNEMARFAEYLVYMTEVKRHINFAEEGVGGLVDLAVITRDKGFTWLNRKGWYDAPGEDGFKI